MQELLTGLFDFSFKKLITPKLAKVIYVLSIIGSVLTALFTIAASPSVFTFLSGIVMCIVSIVCARVAIEVSLAIFQIARYTGEMARRTRGQSVPSTGRDGEFGDSD
ncbi:DUF4282 domain-containing protein [Oligoflexaceae bacterium]|nr:DUF4282 domain-containing protein [Oligoflexaceae bacterium]